MAGRSRTEQTLVLLPVSKSIASITNYVWANAFMSLIRGVFVADVENYNKYHAGSCPHDFAWKPDTLNIWQTKLLCRELLEF